MANRCGSRILARIHFRQVPTLGLGTLERRHCLLRAAIAAVKTLPFSFSLNNVANFQTPPVDTHPLFDDQHNTSTTGITSSWCILNAHASLKQNSLLLIATSPLVAAFLSHTPTQPDCRLLMPVATSPSALLPPSPTVKMEDRKRPSGDDLGPPSKRQQVNGSSKSRDEDRGDESWIEVSSVKFIRRRYTL